jgi:hypothetical protein
MITYDTLKTRPREFLAVTSLTQEEFLQLLPVFACLVQQQTALLTTDGTPRKRQPGGGTKGKLDRIEDKLLFILAYQKGYALQILLGLHFGLSQPQANYWIHRLLPLLQEALAVLDYTPQRAGAAIAGYRTADGQPAELLLDGTERTRQRPKNPQTQKEAYSGKKKSIPTKTCS